MSKVRPMCIVRFPTDLCPLRVCSSMNVEHKIIHFYFGLRSNYINRWISNCIHIFFIRDLRTEQNSINSVQRISVTPFFGPSLVVQLSNSAGPKILQLIDWIRGLDPDPLNFIFFSASLNRHYRTHTYLFHRYSLV